MPAEAGIQVDRVAAGFNEWFGFCRYEAWVGSRLRFGNFEPSGCVRSSSFSAWVDL